MSKHFPFLSILAALLMSNFVSSIPASGAFVPPSSSSSTSDESSGAKNFATFMNSDEPSENSKHRRFLSAEESGFEDYPMSKISFLGGGRARQDLLMDEKQPLRFAASDNKYGLFQGRRGSDDEQLNNGESYPNNFKYFYGLSSPIGDRFRRYPQESDGKADYFDDGDENDNFVVMLRNKSSQGEGIERKTMAARVKNSSGSRLQMVHPERPSLSQPKRKWKSKNMAMWG